MYNSQLKVFVCVADCGSFTKAAEKLFVSPTAVMKQINVLESHLNVRLINRTTQGINLTPAGKIIYKDAKFLFEFSEQSIKKAKKAMNTSNKIFNVGTSLLNPAKPFMDLWNKVNERFPDYKLHLVPFGDNNDGVLSKISQLGEKFDFLLAACDSKLWMNKCNLLSLRHYKKMCAVPLDHPLAHKKCLKISDLYGETLMMGKEGDAPSNDIIREDLRNNHPLIKIEDTPYFYDISVFNHCVENGNILLTLECWQDIHPLLVNIPVEWQYNIPFGLLYALNPSKDVLKLISELKKYGYYVQE